jgi:hypothetical protein
MGRATKLNYRSTIATAWTAARNAWAWPQRTDVQWCLRANLRTYARATTCFTLSMLPYCLGRPHFLPAHNIRLTIAASWRPSRPDVRGGRVCALLITWFTLQCGRFSRLVWRRMRAGLAARFTAASRTRPSLPSDGDVGVGVLYVVRESL